MFIDIKVYMFIGKKEDKMEYTIYNTGESSELYGACEICRELVSKVYTLEYYTIIDRGDYRVKRYRQERIFGHQECLEQKAKEISQDGL